METRHLKIVFIIDESGSMQGTNSDVIGGFNGFIEKQKTENKGKITVSLYKFNDVITRVITNKPAAKVSNLNSNDYTPSGFTALYDAIGQAILETDKHLTNRPETERPDKVMVVIITDGQENASKSYSATAIKSIISTHEDLLHWSFIFLGSGLQNSDDAQAMGIKYQAYAKKENLQLNFMTVAENSINFCTSLDRNETEFMNQMAAELNDLKE